MTFFQAIGCGTSHIAPIDNLGAVHAHDHSMGIGWPIRASRQRSIFSREARDVGRRVRNYFWRCMYSCRPVRFLTLRVTFFFSLLLTFIGHLLAIRKSSWLVKDKECDLNKTEKGDNKMLIGEKEHVHNKIHEGCPSVRWMTNPVCYFWGCELRVRQTDGFYS